MPHQQRNVLIQPRDLELLRLLLHTRVLTLTHTAVFVFDGSKEAAKKRIQKLKSIGFILERRRRVYEPSILFLSKRGFDCLRESGALPKDFGDIKSFSKRASISDLTLQHELQVLDIRVAFHQAIHKQEYLFLAEFSTSPHSYKLTVSDPAQLRGSITTVNPDGYVRIHEKEAGVPTWEHLFFVEVDRSTEKLDTFVERLRLYSLFFRAGGMAVRFGKTAKDYQEVPFRVLVVCKSAERRDNIIRMLLALEPPVLTLVLLATLKEVCADPLGKIWRIPADQGNEATRLLT